MNDNTANLAKAYLDKSREVKQLRTELDEAVKIQHKAEYALGRRMNRDGDRSIVVGYHGNLYVIDKKANVPGVCIPKITKRV